MQKWCSIKALASGVVRIDIYDEIGLWGYKAINFINDLSAAGPGPIDLHIHSPGGDVFDGWAIYSALQRQRDRVTVTIDGIAASMASVIAMAGKTIVMPENAMMMIHDPMGGVFGGVEEMQSYVEMLDKQRTNIVQAYVKRSGQKEADVRAMMDKETWMTAAEAVANGFADRIEQQPVKMVAHAGLATRFRNAPLAITKPTAEELEMTKEEVKRICALAGHPAVADGLADGVKLADVLAAIDKAKADAATAEAAAAATAATEAAAEAARVQAAAGKPLTEEQVRAKLLGEIEEIKSLCALAGMPELADGFVTAKKSAKEVVAELATAQAEKAKGKGKRSGTAAEVSARHASRHEEENGAVALNHGDVWAKYNSAKTAK